MIQQWMQLANSIAASGEGDFWFPKQASTVASSVDDVYYFIYWVSVFFLVLIVGLLVYFAKKYQMKNRTQKAESQFHHSNLVEVVWTIPPLIISVIIFWVSTVAFINQKTMPEDSYEIYVRGWKWAWQFTYPNGYEDSVLHVPKDRPVKLIMSSDDVLHSFFIPAFRVKQDVVPGRYTNLWFEATDAGEYNIFCTEYCGTRHSDMLTKIIVHEDGEFDTWLADASNILDKLSPVEAGAYLYEKKGCNQCHSVDGSSGVGPSFKGKWGTERGLVTGEKVAIDENYIRESVLMPQAKVAEGYAPVMPTYQGKLKDGEISAIIEYIKSLK